MSPRTSNKAKKILGLLNSKLKKQDKGNIITFEEFLNVASKNPYKVFRNVFQLFSDMVYSNVSYDDKYANDPQNISYKTINCDNLLVKDADIPFFADLPLANRLVRLADSFKEGSKQNKLYVFSGPPGSGKSTFINNLLRRFQEYSKTEEGLNYEIFWRINLKKLGPRFSPKITEALVDYYQEYKTAPAQDKRDFLEIACPSHDFPFHIIPQKHRREMLENLISGETKIKIFNKKEYTWVFNGNCCTICNSIFNALSEKLNSPAEVFEMIYAKKFCYDRSLAKGISIYNPGDEDPKQKIYSNPEIQKQLGYIFRDSNIVKYVFSKYATTNNGVYVIMDLKGNNKKRALDLHGIISEGTHKIEDIEENVNSLFIAVLNPEDREIITSHESFKDRMEEIEVNYVLNYTEEVKIYINSFGSQIKAKFLPNVLHNFAKIVISTRLNKTSKALSSWIDDAKKYEKYCDADLFLLKLAIYNNDIPNWLSKEDYSKFNKEIRKQIIKESDNEGRTGFSGRESIAIFNNFYSWVKKKYESTSGTLMINMEDVREFFAKKEEYKKKIPSGFVDSIIRLYNYNLMEQIKECLFHQNEERISKDIQNYLSATTYDVGETISSPFTGEKFEISESFFESIEKYLFVRNYSQIEREKFRNDISSKFTISLQKLNVSEENITSTLVYQDLYNSYMKNLRENIFQPFVKYTSFENAIKAYGTPKFDVFDNKTKEEVSFLIQNLYSKFRFTKEGAKHVCLYILKNNIAEKFK